jgi:tellurite resistance protein TerA
MAIDYSKPGPSVSTVKTGKISLSKGEKVSITKAGTITATVSWPSNTDYDLYAIARTPDGQQVHVATFGARGVPPRSTAFDGSIKHLGDVVRPDASGRANETLQILPSPAWESVLLVAYSAQSNGTGSFYRYQVSAAVSNGQGDEVTIDATHANDDDRVYTLAIALIHNRDGVLEIEALEEYSKRNSEDRPAFDRKGRVKMDAGPRNDYK